MGLTRDLLDLLAVHALGPFREWGCVARVPGLWKVDLALITSYLLKLPASFIPRDQRTLGLEDDGTSLLFGDTPWDTAATVCRNVGLQSSDVVYDLGCGRGKFVFLAHLACGCRTVGVDVLPTYIRIARRIQRLLKLEGVRFEQGDAREVDLTEATVVLVNGAVFSEELHAALRARVNQVAAGGRWISIGHPCIHPRLVPRGGDEERFSWGFERVYYYRVVDVPPEADGTPASFDQVFHEIRGQHAR